MAINSYHSRQAGFTLVETLVAITIFVTVILGPITIAANGMQSAYYANEQATAIFLAQEGLEAVKRLRDNNALDVYNGDTDSWAWYANIPNACKTGTGCGLDIDQSSILGSGHGVGNSLFKACSASGMNNCRLEKNQYANSGTSNGNNLIIMYGYGGGGWSNSIYTRTVRLTPRALGANPNAAVEVTVTVSWSSPVFGNTTRSVVLQSWLYDQYSRYEP